MYYVQPTIDGRSFCATTDLLSVNSTITDVLLIDNPEDSGVNVLVTHVNVGSTLSVALEGKCQIKMFPVPTVTSNGTEITSANMNTGAAAPAAKAKVYKLPTTSARGNKMNMRIRMSKTESSGADQVVCIPPGRKLLVTAEASTNGENMHFDANWLEVPI